MNISFKVSRSLISYFLVAVSGVLIQLVVSSVSQKMFNMGYTSSIGLGYFVAFVVSFFFINRYSFTKDNTGKVRNRILKYILVCIGSGLITAYGSGLCLVTIQKIFNRETISLTISGREIDTFKLFSHFFGMGASFIFNYVLHKRFTFKKTDILNRVRSRFLS